MPSKYIKFVAFFIAGILASAVTLERASSRFSAYIDGCSYSVLISDSDYTAVAAAFVYTHSKWVARSAVSVSYYGQVEGQEFGGAIVDLIVVERHVRSRIRPHELWKVNLSSCGQVIEIEKSEYSGKAIIRY
jgi:hypothetical protein